LNQASAGGFGASPVTAQASFLADCPGQVVSQPEPIDFTQFPGF
jgi:hypothetical protein